MKNGIILLLFAFILTNVSFAQIKNAEISKGAEIILETKAKGTEFSGINYHPGTVNIFFDSKGDPAYVVYEFNPKGFVILSMDENVYPLIAYSFENSFPDNPEELPNLNMWMQNTLHQIEKVREKKLKADNRISTAWNNLTNPSYWQKRSVTPGPLLNTQWDQGMYYNSSCPADPAGSDGHVVTGCVATALGQLMNYFRHPQQGTGSYGYTHPDYGYLQVDFSNQTYNWDAMGNSLSSPNDEVADLLYHIGVSVDMDYGPNSSGMHNHKGAYTLRTYFGYSDTTQYYFRDSLDSSFNWKGLLIDHLKQNIPLYYAGWGDTVFQSGHAFIFDGYQDSSNYHINWGWGGSADGYYNVDDLTPYSSDFTLLHEVIAYATPDINSANTCQGQTVLTFMQGCIGDGSGPLYDYQNNQSCEWLINVDDSVSHIEFELLELRTSPEDSLVIYDGPDDSYPILTSWSDSADNVNISSTNDQVLIRFLTDSSSTDKGWLLNYNAVQPDFCPLVTTINNTNGTINDGSNSYDYQNSTLCVWNLMPGSVKNIHLDFTEFDLEGNDYLRILDQGNNNLIADLTGNQNPGTFDVQTDHLSLTFDTDNSGRAGGWELNYDITPVGKNTILTENNLDIFPNPTTNKFNIVYFSNDKERLNIEICDASGKKVCDKELVANSGENQFDIPVNNLEKGFYIVKIKGADFRKTRKLIIK